MSDIHAIAGGGGLRLHVREWGPKDAPPLLLIHGWAQHHICWQLQAPLARDHRLVALDLRGHGASEAPQDPAAYTDTALWGDDIAGVIDALALDRPVLVGWSYGARVIAAYLDTHGDAGIAGVVLSGGTAALGAAREPWMVGADSPGLNRDLYTEDQPRRLRATAGFVAACTAVPLAPALYAELTASNMLVTPLVRRALFAADLDLRPVYGQLSKPGLVIHGTADTIVAPAAGEANAAAMPHGRYLPYGGIGHAAFLEAPDRFNTDLARFLAETRETA